MSTGLGYMKLKQQPAVLRFHSSSKKIEVEAHYSEMLLFSHWRKESRDIKRDVDGCLEQYQEKKLEIDNNREAIFPGELTVDCLEDQEFELKSIKPVHIYDMLNSQGYESIGYTGNLNLEGGGQFENYEKCRYRKVGLPDGKEMHFMTRRMVPEQMFFLKKVIEACKDVVKCRNNPKLRPKPITLTLLGGQGKKSFL